MGKKMFAELHQKVLINKFRCSMVMFEQLVSEVNHGCFYLW